MEIQSVFKGLRGQSVDANRPDSEGYNVVVSTTAQPGAVAICMCRGPDEETLPISVDEAVALVSIGGQFSERILADHARSQEYMRLEGVDPVAKELKAPLTK